MQKYKYMTVFVALAGIAALPACSSSYDSGWHNQSAQYPYEQPQYPTQNESELYNTAPRDHYIMHEHMAGGPLMEWNEEKINAMADRFFDKADTDQDGYISWPEFSAFMHRKFTDADTDHDNLLSRDEVVAMLRRHMNKIHEEMQGEADGMNYDNDNNYSDNYSDSSAEMEQPQQ